MIDRKIKDGQMLSAHELPLHAVIEDRALQYPIIRLCQKCALECKKHGGKDLTFQCFEFKKEVKE